jgi:hypothetical protein
MGDSATHVQIQASGLCREIQKGNQKGPRLPKSLPENVHNDWRGPVGLYVQRFLRSKCSAESQTSLRTFIANKGFWADLLGIGEFYYELGIRIIEASIATRGSNGGLLPIKDINSLPGFNKATE